VTDQRIIVFDIETIPDLSSGRLLVGENDEAPDNEIRAKIGLRYAKQGEDPSSAFVKVPLQKIVCIGALFAEKLERSAGWEITRFGAGHVGQRSERQIVESFVGSFHHRPTPQLIGFNSSSFDLPVLRYRALALSLPIPDLHRFNGKDYWYRYGRDHLDLCDVLSNFGASARPSLSEMSALCGLPPKLNGIDGARVEELVRANRIEDVSNYCEIDVLSTYLLFLRFALVVGDLTLEAYKNSLLSLSRYLGLRTEKRPHLSKFAALDLLNSVSG